LLSLPQVDQKILTDLGYKDTLNAVDEAILANARFLEQVVADPEIFGGREDEQSNRNRQSDHKMPQENILSGDCRRS
jgi:carnosine N-methyltransferase